MSMVSSTPMNIFSLLDITKESFLVKYSSPPDILFQNFGPKVSLSFIVVNLKFEYNASFVDYNFAKMYHFTSVCVEVVFQTLYLKI